MSERLEEEDQTPRKTILVIEDDATIGEFLVEAVKDETSYRALLAPDGFQALKTLRALKPDLFLLDYHLPRMDGLELYEQIQAKDEFKHIPVLFMSAIIPMKELEKRHISSFIKKPFELEELLHCIENLLTDE